MPVLTRSASATCSNKPYLTPQTPTPTHPRALVDMTPLPSLFDKIVEATKRGRRSTSLRPGSNVDSPFSLPSIPEISEDTSSDPVEVHDIQSTSDTPTEVGEEPESEPMAHQPSDISDHMDCEDTPIAFFEPLNPTPSLAPMISLFAPAPVPPVVWGGVVTSFFPSDRHHLYKFPEPPVTQPPADQGPLLPSELNKLATFPHPATYNLPSTSVNPDSYSLPHEHVSFLLPQMNEQPQQAQNVERGTEYTQYPTLSLPSCPTTPPILSASAPVQNTIDPVDLPVFAQSFPTFTTNPHTNSRRRVSDTFGNPRPPAVVKTYHRLTLDPQPQQRLELDDIFARQSRPITRLPSWRIREIERQREMDRIAEPYLARLREISLQKKAEAEARALTGKEKMDQTDEEQERSWWDFLRREEKKALKDLTEIERQQRSEDRREAMRDGKRSNLGENAPSDSLEKEVSVSARRKRTGRSKPYRIPHPATRSPRRSNTMPGGFGSDDLTLSH